MDCTTVILRPRPTCPCVVCVASTTLQLLKFCAEKSSAFRQFSSACLMDCSAVILMPRPTFPYVVRVVSAALSILQIFRVSCWLQLQWTRQMAAAAQFSSAGKIDCTVVILMPRPTFSCVVCVASASLQLLKFYHKHRRFVSFLLLEFGYGCVLGSSPDIQQHSEAPQSYLAPSCGRGMPHRAAWTA